MNKKLDICEWVLSEDVQKYLQEQTKLVDSMSVLEKAYIVIHAFRPVEEKAKALELLLKEARTKKEQEKLQKKIDFYRAGLRWIHDPDPESFHYEHVFYLEYAQCDENSDTPWEFPDQYIIYPYITLKRALIRAAEEATNNSNIINFQVNVFNWNSEYDFIWMDGIEQAMKDLHDMRVWAGNTRPYWEQTDEAIIYLEKKDNQVIINDFTFGEEWMEREGVEDVDIHSDKNNAFLLDDLSTLFPFKTGDLVMLDAPVFPEPITGVILFRGRACEIGFIWRGDFETYSMDMDILPYDRNEYRPVDWLHRASEADLLAEQKVLGRIGRCIGELWNRDKEQACQVFYDIFDSWNYSPEDFEDGIPILDSMRMIQKEKREALIRAYQEERTHRTAAVYSMEIDEYVIDENILEEVVRQFVRLPVKKERKKCRWMNLEDFGSLPSFRQSEFISHYRENREDEHFSVYDDLYEDIGYLNPEDRVWLTSEVQEDGTVRKILHVEMEDQKIKPVILDHYEICIREEDQEGRGWRLLKPFQKDMKWMEKAMEISVWEVCQNICEHLKKQENL